MKRELLLQCLNKFEKLWDIGIDAEYKVELLPEIRALREELAKPQNEFHPDWDTLQPYHDRIAELEAQLALEKKANNARELGLDYEPEQPELRKAAEMAMKWLEATHHTAMRTYSDEAYKEHCNVEKELRQALAQPEQDKDNLNETNQALIELCEALNDALVEVCSANPKIEISRKHDQRIKNATAKIKELT